MNNSEELINRLKPIDDTFFEVLAQDKEVCQEILRTILEEPYIEVIEVCPQKSIKNLHGRSVRLDVLCKRKDGSLCNIEVQKSDNDDHIRRMRYNEACITANVTKSGTKFENVPDVYMICISRFDIFNKNRTIYHVRKVITETGDIINDGVYEIYVNTQVDDGSEIADLMRCFEQDNVVNPKFPAITRRVGYFKNSKEGRKHMCSLVDEYAKEYALKRNIEFAVSLVKKNALSIEDATKQLGISVEEFKKYLDKE